MALIGRGCMLHSPVLRSTAQPRPYSTKQESIKMLEATHEYTRNFVPGIEPALGDPTSAPASGGVFPIFFLHDEYDEERSTELGRPYFRSIEMVRLIIPGDRTAAPERLVREEDTVKYAKQYEHFKKTGEIAESGTPLEQWQILTRSQVASLKFQNIYTVEQLAELADDKLDSIGIGARMLRKQAQAMLETSKTGSLPASLVAENEQLKGHVGMLTEQIAQLANKLEAMSKDQGANVADMADPLAEAKQVVKVARGETIEIPDNYHKLGLKALRALCEKFTPAAVANREDAFALIEEYLESRSR